MGLWLMEIVPHGVGGEDDVGAVRVTARCGVGHAVGKRWEMKGR